MSKPIQKQMAVSVIFDVVKIEVHCKDNYEAQVLYDDVVERMQAGEGITLSVMPGTVKAE
jgi:hypothetical protein